MFLFLIQTTLNTDVRQSFFNDWYTNFIVISRTITSAQLTTPTLEFTNSVSNPTNFIPQIITSIQQCNLNRFPNTSNSNLPSYVANVQVTSVRANDFSFSLNVPANSFTSVSYRFMLYYIEKLIPGTFQTHTQQIISQSNNQFYSGATNNPPVTRIVAVNFANVNSYATSPPILFITLLGFQLINHPAIATANLAQFKIGIGSERTITTSSHSLVYLVQGYGVASTKQSYQFILFNNKTQSPRYSFLMIRDEVLSQTSVLNYGVELTRLAFKGSGVSFIGSFTMLGFSNFNSISFRYSFTAATQSTKFKFDKIGGVSSTTSMNQADLNYFIAVMSDCYSDSPYYFDKKCYMVCPDGLVINTLKSVCQNCQTSKCLYLSVSVIQDLRSTTLPKYFINLTFDKSLPSQEPAYFTVVDKETNILWLKKFVSRGPTWLYYQIMVNFKGNYTLQVKYPSTLSIRGNTLYQSTFQTTKRQYLRSSFQYVLKEDSKFIGSKSAYLLFSNNISNQQLASQTSFIQLYLNKTAIKFKPVVMNYSIFLLYQPDFYCSNCQLLAKFDNNSRLLLYGKYPLSISQSSIILKFAFNNTDSTAQSQFLKTFIKFSSIAQNVFSFLYLMGMELYCHRIFQIYSQFFLFSKSSMPMHHNVKLFFNASESFRVAFFPSLFQQQMNSLYLKFTKLLKMNMYFGHLYQVLFGFIFTWIFIVLRTLIFRLIFELLSLKQSKSSRLRKQFINQRLGNFSNLFSILPCQYVLFYHLVHQFRVSDRYDTNHFYQQIVITAILQIFIFILIIAPFICHSLKSQPNYQEEFSPVYHQYKFLDHNFFPPVLGRQLQFIKSICLAVSVQYLNENSYLLVIFLICMQSGYILLTMPLRMYLRNQIIRSIKEYLILIMLTSFLFTAIFGSRMSLSQHLNLKIIQYVVGCLTLCTGLAETIKNSYDWFKHMIEQIKDMKQVDIKGKQRQSQNQIQSVLNSKQKQHNNIISYIQQSQIDD